MPSPTLVARDPPWLWGAAPHSPLHPSCLREVPGTRDHCPGWMAAQGSVRATLVTPRPLGTPPYPPRMSLELRSYWELTLVDRRVTMRCAKGAGGGGTSSAQGGKG